LTNALQRLRAPPSFEQAVSASAQEQGAHLIAASIIVTLILS
jgi:hypothetical protein